MKKLKKLKKIKKNYNNHKTRSNNNKIMSKRLSTGNGFVLDSLTYAIGPLRLSDFIKICEKTRDTAF